MRPKEQRPTLEKLIKNFRLMDDRFMSVCLKDNIECVQLMIRIIMKKPDIVVVNMETQETVKSLTGRDVVFDVTATDSAGKIYDIEIQRPAGSKEFKRPRYYASILDSKSLEHGAPISELRESYVIFITENDPL